MKTVDRTLATTLRRVSESFPVLLVTGPRQVGKTTLLELCATPDRRFVTLDDLDLRELARRDPALFLQRHPPPLTIDESHITEFATKLSDAARVYVPAADD